MTRGGEGGDVKRLRGGIQGGGHVDVPINASRWLLGELIVQIKSSRWMHGIILEDPTLQRSGTTAQLSLDLGEEVLASGGRQRRLEATPQQAGATGTTYVARFVAIVECKRCAGIVYGERPVTRGAELYLLLERVWGLLRLSWWMF